MGTVKGGQKRKEKGGEGGQLAIMMGQLALKTLVDRRPGHFICLLQR